MSTAYILTAPSYVKSAIRTAEKEAQLQSKGVEFALPEDCTGAIMRLACDDTITGQFSPRQFHCVALLN